MPLARADDVLEFWFGPADPGPDGSRTTERAEWFRKDPAFDAAIEERFGETIDVALSGGLGDWCASARGALARVIVLDQFTRNVFRDTPSAFAGDARALATAEDAIARGFERELAPVERWFLYMPFVHSEELARLEQSLLLFRKLADETGLRDPLDWAEKHAGVIRRFGRYPHRNRVLGRASTAEEEAFLRTPGSRF